MMLAEPQALFNSAGFLQVDLSASTRHESKWRWTRSRSDGSTLFRTKPFNVLRAMTLTS